MTAPLVVFGEDWGRHPSSTQHLVRRLARQAPVVWVNSIGLRRPRLAARDLRRAAGKVFRSRIAAGEGAVAIEPPPHAMTVISPVAVPWPGSRLAASLNRELLSRQILPRLAERGLARPVLWTSLPTALPVVGHLGERAVVYYCGDDFGALVGVDHEPVLEMEARLVEKADLVMAASEALAARFPSHKTLLVPHGADVRLFTTPAPRAADLPTGKPVAGFYGSISDWIDVELLLHAARELSDWHFVLIGAVETDVTPLQNLANVTFLGRRPHADLSSYAQHWDVSLLPFRDTAQIRACNPLKLREYMAAGSAIVATEFPALAPYRDLISVANGGDAFVAAMRASLHAPDRRDERRRRVAGETWEARAAEVARAIEAL